MNTYPENSGDAPPGSAPPFHFNPLGLPVPDLIAPVTTQTPSTSTPRPPIETQILLKAAAVLDQIQQAVWGPTQAVADLREVQKKLDATESRKDELKEQLREALSIIKELVLKITDGLKAKEFEAKNVDLQTEVAILQEEMKAAVEVLRLQRQLSPPEMTPQAALLLSKAIKEIPSKVVVDFFADPHTLALLPAVVGLQLKKYMANLCAQEPRSTGTEETFDNALQSLIGRLNGLNFNVEDPVFKAEIAAIKQLREFLNESYPAKLDAVKAKERKMAEVVLALKLTCNEVQGNLDCASLKVKELEERIRSQEIANIAKEVVNTMIMEIEAKEQEDKDTDMARRYEKDLQKAINKLEGENKVKTDQMEQHYQVQVRNFQEQLMSKNKEIEDLRKAGDEKQRTMDYWKQEIPKIVGNYSRSAGKRQRMDDDKA